MTTAEAPPAGIHIGPTGAPAHTLGLQVLGWTAEYLTQPDGPNAGEMWKCTPEQVRFIAWWYAVDRAGRFVYRSGMLRRMKGWGKDPLGAMLCCIEFVGPCRFGGWRDGEPVAVPHSAAWVQTAAVSRDQTRNTMTLFPGMISPRAIEEYRIDLGKEIIYGEGGRRRIEAVTSSPRALEGGRATFVLKNETHHWLRPNEGHEMAAVIARNVAKSRDGSARVLAISNAHAPGEDSDAEHDYEAWRKIDDGTSKATGFLYDSLEAPPTDLDDDAALEAGLLAARGGSYWLDVQRLIEEIRDPRTSASIARRFYLNQIVAEEDKPFDRVRFAELAAPHDVPAGTLIALGFDGSVSRDHTALIGTEVATGYQWVVGYWAPRATPGGDMIDVGEVDQTVAAAFERWQVFRLNADPSKWGPYMASWESKYGRERIVTWPTAQYRKMAYAIRGYADAINLGELSHDGDPRLVGSIGNSHKRMMQFGDDQGERMHIIQKERPDSPLKIDAAIAAVLSREAALAAVAAGAHTRQAPIDPSFTPGIGGGPEMRDVRGKDF